MQGVKLNWKGIRAQSLKLISSLFVGEKMAYLFLMCSNSCYHGEQVSLVLKVLCMLVASMVSIHIHQESFTVFLGTPTTVPQIWGLFYYFLLES